MGRRLSIAIGMAAGAGWAVGVLWLGAQAPVPMIALPFAIALSFLPPGLILAAMIARLSQRRFFDETIIDGQATTGGAEIDRRVLVNTVEQIVLALCIWPALAVLLGPAGAAVSLVLEFSFVVARIAFWIGYHVSSSARAFGFAATFYPTVFAGVWAIWHLARMVG